MFSVISLAGLGIGAALAGTPDRVAYATDIGSIVGDVVAAPDGSWVAAYEAGAGQVHILDMTSWETSSYAPCESSHATAMTVVEVDGEAVVYVGCQDSTLTWIDTADGNFGNSGSFVDLEDGEVFGLAEANGALILVVEQADDGGNPQVHHYDPAGSLNGTGNFPETLGNDGFVDIVTGGDLAVIAHGGDSLSKVDLGTGSPSVSDGGTSLLSAVDVYYTSGSAFLASGGEAVVAFDTSANDIELLIDEDLVDAAGIVELTEEGEVLLADHGRSEFIVYTMGSSGVPGDEEQGTIAFPDSVDEDDEDTVVNEMVTVGDYVIAGTSRGELWVLTEVPWVTVGSASPSSAVMGEEVSLAFISDMAGDWELFLNDDTTALDSGEVSADEEVTAAVVVDASFGEGDNYLRVEVTSDGLTGHGAAVVSVDNPPSQVQLYDTSLGFGNSQLTLSFDGVDDEDLVGYEVYLTTTEFSPEDYPTGGPEFDGDDDIDDDDLSVEREPGKAVTVTLSPLTNGVVYYVAVRALDEGGQEGEMSKVVSASPERTYSAAGLSGEPGGFCGTATPVGLALTLGAGLLAFGRRRRGVGAAVALVGLGLGLGLGGSAHAHDPKPEGAYDPAKRNGSFSLRGGPIALTDSTLTDIFGESGNEVFWVEGGPSYTDYVDVVIGIGWMQELGWLVTEDGQESDEHDMLTALPVTAGLNLRLDVFDNQILVPSAGAGGDVWLWRENWYVNPDVGGEGKISGGKYGWHWNASLQLLLDAFEPNRASRLQARSGIDDSYLVFEYRSQTVGEWQSGLQFSGTAWSLGIKVNY